MALLFTLFGGQKFDINKIIFTSFDHHKLLLKCKAKVGSDNQMYSTTLQQPEKDSRRLRPANCQTLNGRGMNGQGAARSKFDRVQSLAALAVALCLCILYCAKVYTAKVWTARSYFGPFKVRQPNFEWALPLNKYNYTLPAKVSIQDWKKKILSDYHFKK